jgi:hypothetical protein
MGAQCFSVFHKSERVKTRVYAMEEANLHGGVLVVVAEAIYVREVLGLLWRRT